MACTPIRMPGGGVAIVCSRERRRRCQEPGCDRWATKQCDFPLDRVRYPRKSGSKTCDRWLCVSHAVSIGPNRDYCPHHPRPSVGQGDLFGG